MVALALDAFAARRLSELTEERDREVERRREAEAKLTALTEHHVFHVTCPHCNGVFDVIPEVTDARS